MTASPRPREEGHCWDEPRRGRGLMPGSPPRLWARREPRSWRRGAREGRAADGLRLAGLWGAVCCVSLPESSRVQIPPPDKDGDPRYRVTWKGSWLPSPLPPATPHLPQCEPCSCPRVSTHSPTAPSFLLQLRSLSVRLREDTSRQQPPIFESWPGARLVPPPSSEGGRGAGSGGQPPGPGRGCRAANRVSSRAHSEACFCGRGPHLCTQGGKADTHWEGPGCWWELRAHAGQLSQREADRCTRDT